MSNPEGFTGVSGGDIYGLPDIYAVQNIWSLFNAQTIFVDGGPVWSQVRAWGTAVEWSLTDAASLTVTSSYTLQPTDQSEIVFLSSTTAFNTLTVSAVGGYSEVSKFTIVNIGTRGWKININGIAPFVLWPGQSFLLSTQGTGAWQTLYLPRRWKIRGNSVVLYVAPSGGSAQNDGLGPDAPLDTMFTAICQALADKLDIDFATQPGITVQLMDGTHTVGLVFPGQLFHAAGNFSIVVQGNLTNPKAVTVNDPANPAFSLFNRAWINIANMVVMGHGAAVSGLTDSIIRIGAGITFGTVSGQGPHILMESGSRCIVDNGYTIAGNAAYHVQCFSGSEYLTSTPVTVQFGAHCGFGGNFAYANTLSNINFLSVNFVLGGYPVTGNRCKIIIESLLQVHGTSADNLPGSTSGTIDSSSTLFVDGAQSVPVGVYTPIFPPLIGLGFDVVRTEKWSTNVQDNLSGKQVAIANWSAPKFQWELSFEFLENFARAGQPYGDWQNLQSFFADVNGRFAPFLILDPDDNQAVNQVIGFGDGVTTQFAIVRTLGNANDPILAANFDFAGPAGIQPAMYIDGIQTATGTYGAYGCATQGLITFNPAPPANSVITVTFSFWWPVRFDDDAMSFNKFVAQLYANKKVTFTSVK